MTTLRPAQIEALDARAAPEVMAADRRFLSENAKIVEWRTKRKRTGRPNYSYRAMRRNGCIRFAGYKWAEFQRARPWTWRSSTQQEGK